MKWKTAKGHQLVPETPETSPLSEQAPSDIELIVVLIRFLKSPKQVKNYGQIAAGQQIVSEFLFEQSLKLQNKGKTHTTKPFAATHVSVWHKSLLQLRFKKLKEKTSKNT